MILNDIEWRNNAYLAFFLPNSIALLANYVTVVEDRPITSAKYCRAVSVFHFWPKLSHPAARSLCDCWATCYLQPLNKVSETKCHTCRYATNRFALRSTKNCSRNILFWDIIWFTNTDARCFPNFPENWPIPSSLFVLFNITRPSRQQLSSCNVYMGQLLFIPCCSAQILLFYIHVVEQTDMLYSVSQKK